MKRIKKLAIANRGEVAVRIIRACQELGIKNVLLHSQADRGTLAYRMSDEQICIGESPVEKSYLSIEKNLDGVLASGADALHPGFGFLSENAKFAEVLKDHKIIFIGPDSHTIAKMGDKVEAKKLADEIGIPLIPDYRGQNQELSHLTLQAERLGFPVMVKATGGGGGRGLKVIQNREQCMQMISAAKREALSAFGNEKVFLEKYLDRAKHIEVQIFSDLSGQVVHLFDRECSIQRRHQKIIEESLSPSLDQSLRSKLTEAACKLAKAVNYIGVGTVEFLVQGDQFYFLEMNTRLQVEHPVTEWVLGVDLVKAQILCKMNRFAAWAQDLLWPRGHSIECRLYAENPYSEGIPSVGWIGYQQWPQGPGRRFDYGYEAGDEVTTFYDPMMAKVIVWDETRPRAIKKMLKTLDETIVFGVQTNIPLLKQILTHPEFVDGSFHTQFMDQYFPQGAIKPKKTKTDQKIAELCYQKVSEQSPLSQENPSPWSQSWSNV